MFSCIFSTTAYCLIPQKSFFYTCSTGDVIVELMLKKKQKKEHTHSMSSEATKHRNPCDHHQLQMNISLSSSPSRIKPVQSQLNCRTITPCSIDFTSCGPPSVFSTLQGAGCQVGRDALFQFLVAASTSATL